MAGNRPEDEDEHAPQANTPRVDDAQGGEQPAATPEPIAEGPPPAAAPLVAELKPRPQNAKETDEERRQRIAEKVARLPTEPGCYIMRDRKGKVFYIGKASSLRARVRSYFSGSDTRQFVAWLDHLLWDLDFVLVNNEKEALLLERTLVRQHQPLE